MKAYLLIWIHFPVLIHLIQFLHGAPYNSRQQEAKKCQFFHTHPAFKDHYLKYNILIHTMLK